MTMRYDDGPFTSTPGEKPWSQCLHRWKVSIVSVLLFLLLPLLTTYRQNYYLVMGDTFMQDPWYNISTQCCNELSRCRRSAPVGAQDGITEIPNSTAALRNTTLTEDLVDDICKRINENRTNSEVHLNFCEWRTLSDTIILDIKRNVDDQTLRVDQLTCLQMRDINNCTACLREIMNLDQHLEELAQEHKSKLDRYDCEKKYSMWGCSNCTDVYKDWLCATAFQYVHNDRWVKPSIRYCKHVTTQCPYLLPDIPYCGQRSFDCPDEDSLRNNKASYTADPPCFICEENMPRLPTYSCDSLIYSNLTQKCRPSRSAATSLYRASITVSTCFMIGALWLVLCILQQLYDLPEGYT